MSLEPCAVLMNGKFTNEELLTLTRVLQAMEQKRPTERFDIAFYRGKKTHVDRIQGALKRVLEEASRAPVEIVEAHGVLVGNSPESTTAEEDEDFERRARAHIAAVLQEVSGVIMDNTLQYPCLAGSETFVLGKISGELSRMAGGFLKASKAP